MFEGEKAFFSRAIFGKWVLPEINVWRETANVSVAAIKYSTFITIAEPVNPSTLSLFRLPTVASANVTEFGAATRHVAQITGIISNSSSLDENRLYNSHQESYLYIQCTNFPFGIIFFSIGAEILTFCIHRKRFLTFPFVLGCRCSGTSDDSLPLCSSHSSDMRSINSGKFARAKESHNCSSLMTPQHARVLSQFYFKFVALFWIEKMWMESRACNPIENRISLHNRSGEKYFRFCNGIPLKWTLAMIPFTLSHHLLIEREHPRGK